MDLYEFISELQASLIYMRFCLKTTKNTSNMYPISTIDESMPGLYLSILLTELLRRQGQTGNHTRWGLQAYNQEGSGINFWFQQYHDNAMNLLMWTQHFFADFFIHRVKTNHPLSYVQVTGTSNSHTNAECSTRTSFYNISGTLRSAAFVVGRNGFTPPNTCEGYLVSISSSKCQPGIKACTVSHSEQPLQLQSKSRQELVLTS